ncbi:hypothetical protein O181_099588 [Austropuccinia psidii MF-1]|uniref:Peptidase A2 domain-containing protein n=1 Tax=Austropuccinia psidii MF-1 TaxID=1389203 RepID=A0A9Q3JCZ6_9BASI|nr:hypothetical protein [Austropuccinia psidii MF-1]
MFLSSPRKKNPLVLKRRGGLKKACATIVVESTHFKNASRGLDIGRVHQEASLASREKPEWNHDLLNGSHLFPSRAQLCTLNTCVKKSLKFLIFSSLYDISYSILIDSGPTNSFIAKDFVLRYSLTMSKLPQKIPIFILDSNVSTSLFITHYTKWVVDLPSLPSIEWDFFIIDSPKGENLILGYDFLYHFNPIINFKNGLITYDYSGIPSSTSNDFATAVTSVALVGELKTPSLPFSVHIPSIMTSQSLL